MSKQLEPKEGISIKYALGTMKDEMIHKETNKQESGQEVDRSRSRFIESLIGYVNRDVCVTPEKLEPRSRAIFKGLAPPVGVKVRAG